jgi:hypothetical protein
MLSKNHTRLCVRLFELGGSSLTDMSDASPPPKKRTKRAPKHLACIVKHKAIVKELKMKHAARVATLAITIRDAAAELQQIETNIMKEAKSNPEYIKEYSIDKASFDVFGPISDSKTNGTPIEGAGFQDIRDAARVLHTRVTAKAYGSLCGHE